MALRHGPEEAVEKIEADAEICVHGASVVHAAMMDVMQPSRFQEPRFQDGNFRHPEILDVHPVVQVAEHQGGPDEQGAKRQHLVDKRDSK